MLFNPFGRRTAVAIMQDQLFEASLALVEHQAAAEHHHALAAMYDARVHRLRAALFSEPDEALTQTGASPGERPVTVIRRQR